MKRSADFGFLHSSVCVNIKLQLQKSLKKTQNIIRFRKTMNKKHEQPFSYTQISNLLACGDREG